MADTPDKSDRAPVAPRIAKTGLQPVQSATFPAMSDEAREKALLLKQLERIRGVVDHIAARVAGPPYEPAQRSEPPTTGHDHNFLPTAKRLTLDIEKQVMAVKTALERAPG